MSRLFSADQQPLPLCLGDCLHRRRWVGCSGLGKTVWVAGNLMCCTSREMGGLACLRSQCQEGVPAP